MYPTEIILVTLAKLFFKPTCAEHMVDHAHRNKFRQIQF
jgi:hypothetical protein